MDGRGTSKPKCYVMLRQVSQFISNNGNGNDNDIDLAES